MKTINVKTLNVFPQIKFLSVYWFLMLLYVMIFGLDFAFLILSLMLSICDDMRISCTKSAPLAENIGTQINKDICTYVLV